MKTSVTVSFFLMFLVVAFFFFYLMPADMDREKNVKQSSEMSLLKLEDDDAVTLIQIQNLDDNESITLRLEDGKWMIKFPIDAAADHFMIQGLVTALTASKKARRLEREGSWEEYGLRKANLKIGVETEKGSERRYLLLGDKAPLGNNIFSRWADEDEYFLLDENLKKAFSRSVYSLRLKQVFTHSLGEIVKLRFRTENDEYELARHEDKWFWMEPIPILGEVVTTHHMNEVLASLRDLYIKEFLDEENKNKRELGFTLLGKSIKVWSKNSDQPSVLLVGKTMPSRDAAYGMIEGDKSYFLISKSNVESLIRSVEELAGKFLTDELKSSNVLAA